MPGPSHPPSNPLHVRSVLVIEDDRTLNRLMCDQIDDMGYVARGARSRAEAQALLDQGAPDLAILDVRLPDTDGLAFLPHLADLCPVIMLTAYGSIDQAVTAVRAGAVDYLVKPVTREALDLAVARIFETQSLKRDVAFWQAEAQRVARFDLIGDSPAMRELTRLIGLIAASDSPVLIRGEGGTGKSVVANAIHSQSGRANGRLITIDCDSDLTAAELFGSEAQAGGPRRDGLLAPVESGTVFFNDVERLPPALQGPVLRLIEQRVYRPQGSTVARPCPARFIAATSVDLEDRVRQGHYRADLFYQLSGLVVMVPPLRERREDIPALARSLLAGRAFQRGIDKDFTPEALAALAAYDWPGNIRELHNAIDRSIIMSADSADILPVHFGLHPAPASPPDALVSLRFDHLPSLEEIRQVYLDDLLDRFGGNRQRVAETMGISERNTYRLLKKR
ncbi:sigma-54-dependent transcriptional regulator [Paracoccus sp. p4-l81]|uniref:sigma-54-dependent transcriptional regulator n=1 Tax=unclassified Paracoccus (in: a-proteobacteria) TaxID=2688777 RepID=UPI0035B76FF9